MTSSATEENEKQVWIDQYAVPELQRKHERVLICEIQYNRR